MTLGPEYKRMLAVRHLASPGLATVAAGRRRIFEVLPLRLLGRRRSHQKARDVLWRVRNRVGHGVSAGTAARSCGLVFLSFRHDFFLDCARNYTTNRTRHTTQKARQYLHLASRRLSDAQGRDGGRGAACDSLRAVRANLVWRRY